MDPVLLFGSADPRPCTHLVTLWNEVSRQPRSCQLPWLRRHGKVELYHEHGLGGAGSRYHLNYADRQVHSIFSVQPNIPWPLFKAVELGAILPNDHVLLLLGHTF